MTPGIVAAKFISTTTNRQTCDVITRKSTFIEYSSCTTWRLWKLQVKKIVPTFFPSNVCKEEMVCSNMKTFFHYLFCLRNNNNIYSCVADNSLGRSKKYMEVSGRPGPAEFHSAPWSRSQDSYNLTWKVDSYPPLQEVRLLYRKLMVSQTSITICFNLKHVTWLL